MVQLDVISFLLDVSVHWQNVIDEMSNSLLNRQS